MRLFSRRPRPSVAPVESAPGAGSGPAAPPAPASPSATAVPVPAFAAFDATLESRIRTIGAELLQAARAHRAGLLSGAFWSDKLMDFTMKDPAFKVQLFRFVDCLPRLKTPEQVHEHLVDYLGRGDLALPPGLGLGLRAGGLAKGAASKVMTNRIEAMASKFIAGRDLADAMPVLEKLRKRGLAFSVDLLGEAVVSPAEADAVRTTYLELVRGLPERTKAWPEDVRLDRDHLGPIPRANVSVKITALHPAVDPIGGTAMLEEMEEALRPVLEAARDAGCFVNFDMEQHALKDFTLDLFERCCEAVDFHAGMAMQAYLRSGDADARRIADWARRTGRQVTIRLVKGAYWDYQTIHAEMENVPSPVWGRKRESDACFERMATIFADAIPRSAGEGGTKLALGSHNARSIAAALALVEQRDLPPSALELQMLHGMGEELKEACVDRGLRLREYVPVGEMIPGMAYLVRRLLENTSNESWLRAGFAEGADESRLLASPHDDAAAMTTGHEHLATAPERHRLSPAVAELGDGRPFIGEAPISFAAPAARTALRAAFDAPRITVEPRPADAGTLETLRDRGGTLARRSPIDRGRALAAWADALRRERTALVADLVTDAGLAWTDAAREVRAAIEHVDLAARAAATLPALRRLGRYVGEFDQHGPRPLGLVAVRTRSADPLAIPLAFTAAALGAGNAVALAAGPRPPAALARAATLLDTDEAAALVHGEDEALVRAALVDGLAGCLPLARVHELAAISAASPTAGLRVRPLAFLPRTANPVIVDASADLDEAVNGVRDAAFGMNGRHPLACRRAIVVHSAADAFIDRLVAATACLAVGDPRGPATDVGPLLDPEDRRGAIGLVHAAIDGGDATRLLGDPVEEADPRFVPCILRVRGASPLDAASVAAPLLAIEVVADMEAAIVRANAASPLAVGLHTRKPGSLEAARQRLVAPLVVLNRALTAVRPGRQPMPLLGTAASLGGLDLPAALARGATVVESTLRQGFAPELAD